MVEYLHIAFVFYLEVHAPQFCNEIIYLDQSVIIELGTCNRNEGECFSLIEHDREYGGIKETSSRG